ncbi:hypothetical protein C0585_04945 [Candidatus Woesearchaeota archaeon]|nr:MAG: hypothetical protein C0585_04945 [Candidatus Woesearchaeota archaeon]
MKKKRVQKKKLVTKKTDNKILYAISATIIILTIILLIFQQTDSDEEEITEINLDNLETGAISKIRDLYQPERDKYGKVTNSNIAIKDLIEKELPPLPEDFWKIKYAFINYQEDKQLCDIEEKYYLQPEWIGQPSKFVDIQIPYYKEGFEKTNWYREGYGGYPAIHRITTQPGEEFRICTYMFTGWRVETYQGINLEPIMVDKIIWDDNYENVILDEGSNFISISLEEPEFLLEPVYPLFKEGWIKKVVMTVKIDENANIGTYGYKLNVLTPSIENSEKWVSEYKELYAHASFVSSSVPAFQAIIDIQ